MHWLTKLLGVIAPPATGIEVDEPDPIAVSVGTDAGGFVRAIGLLVDSDAILYWEGRTSRTLAAWMDRRTLEPRQAVRIGIAPVGDFYHLPLDAESLDELALRVNQPGAIRRPIRLHVHQSDRIVLQWRRAFTSEPVLVSRHLDPARVHSFVAAVGRTR
jgi:hypothetical protein